MNGKEKNHLHTISDPFWTPFFIFGIEEIRGDLDQQTDGFYCIQMCLKLAIVYIRHIYASNSIIFILLKGLVIISPTLPMLESPSLYGKKK